MIDWIRSLFSKPEVPSRSITFKQLPAFIKEQEAVTVKRLSAELSQKNTTLTEHKTAARSLLDKLETATLHNPNIPNKERQIMEGNRDSYIKHARILLHQLKVPHTLEDITHRYTEAKEAIKSYETTTQKPMKILFHFFEHETKQIHRQIGMVMKIFDQINSLLKDDRYKAVQAIKQACDAYTEAIEKRKAIAESIKEQEQLITDRKGKLDEYKKALKKLQQSDPFKQAIQTKEGLEAVRTERKAIEQQVAAQFAKIERAIRKHERIALGSISLANPLTAVREPKACIEALKQVQGAIQRGTIDLKNAEKIIDELERMPAFVEDISAKLVQVEADEKKHLARINTDIFDEEQQFVAQIEGMQQTISAMQQQLDELQEAHTAIQPKEHIAEAGKAVEKIEGVEFVVESGQKA